MNTFSSKEGELLIVDGVIVTVNDYLSVMAEIIKTKILTFSSNEDGVSENWEISTEGIDWTRYFSSDTLDKGNLEYDIINCIKGVEGVVNVELESKVVEATLELTILVVLENGNEITLTERIS